jgi:hypothetical protein
VSPSAEKLFHELPKREAGGRLPGVEALHERDRELGESDRASLRGVRDLLNVAEQTVEVEELGEWDHLFGRL